MPPVAVPTTAHPEPVVAAHAVSRRFASRLVLRPLTLRVGAGERVALLGPNGAGKTTLLRILMTVQRPSSGTLRLFGLDPEREGDAVRSRIGVVAHQSLLHGELTALENLRYYAALYDLDRPEERARDTLSRVGLATRGAERVRQFSRGMQQRLALARALLPAPALLLLDEPDAGLDVRALDLLPPLFATAEDSATTIIFTTHQIDRALRLASRALVLVAGRLVYDGPTAALGASDVAVLYGADQRGC